MLHKTSTIQLSCLLVPLIGLVTSAFAGDLVSDSAPMKWIEPYLAEDMPELSYPAYFNDLDKAQAQEMAGRYKLSLITLKVAKDIKPDQQADVALIKGQSLAALGRWDEALDALAGDDPRVQVEKALVLSKSGKDKDSLALLKSLVQ